MNSYRLVGLTLTLTCVAALPAAAQYTFVDLNPAGRVYSFAYAVSGGQAVGSGYDGNNEYNALLWPDPLAAATNLDPPDYALNDGYYRTEAFGVAGAQQVGYGFYKPASGSGTDHALLWNGQGTDFVDLHPVGWSNSRALAASEAQQVGYGGIVGVGTHAALWEGSAASVIDLNATGMSVTYATGVSAGQQVGWGWGTRTSGWEHALLWAGTAESMVDLNPSGWRKSFAYAVCDGQQVGYGYRSGQYHALLWSGSSTSYVDLNPLGFTRTEAYGVTAAGQVGSGFGAATGDAWHALLWMGTAGSSLDLHQFLGTGYTESHARGIDAAGNIVGYAKAADGNFHAALWRRDPAVVPEAGPLTLMACGLVPFVALLRRRGRM